MFGFVSKRKYEETCARYEAHLRADEQEIDRLNAAIEEIKAACAQQEIALRIAWSEQDLSYRTQIETQAAKIKRLEKQLIAALPPVDEPTQPPDEIEYVPLKPKRTRKKTAVGE